LRYPASESLHPLSEGWQTSPESVAALAWNQWQACRGMGGSFAMESVADFVRNTHIGMSRRQNLVGPGAVARHDTKSARIVRLGNSGAALRCDGGSPALGATAPLLLGGLGSRPRLRHGRQEGRCGLEYVVFAALVGSGVARAHGAGLLWKLFACPAAGSRRGRRSHSSTVA